MFNSTVLEVAIGMVFCYASVALITSSIYEAIASWLSLRSKTLFDGIKSLLNGQNGNNLELILGIYNHALASPLGDGTAKKLEDIKQLPSYIESKHFALALIDTIQSASGNFEKLGQDIDNIKDEQIKRLLQDIYSNSAGSIEKIQKDVATWFDTSMNRLSGSYKRQSQKWCFGIAFALAVVFNIDSFYLFKVLWQHPGLVAQIAATENPSTELIQGLNKLPIGWGWGTDKEFLEILATPLGWALTASASLFGGPFWFDLLKTLINLRGTGIKPPTASDSPAKDVSSAKASAETLALRNSLIDLHTARNETDESYRPVQAEERW